VPPEVANWVGYHESGWNNNAVGPQTSSGKAQGPWQFMPGTADQYGLKDPTDFAASTDAAMHKLSDLYKKTGDWGEAVREYGTFSTGLGPARDAAVRQGFNSYMAANKIPVGQQQAGAAAPGVVPGGGAAPAGPNVLASVNGGPVAAPGAAPAPNALAQQQQQGPQLSPNGRTWNGVAGPISFDMWREANNAVLSGTPILEVTAKMNEQRNAQLGQLVLSGNTEAKWDANVDEAFNKGLITRSDHDALYGNMAVHRQQALQTLAGPDAALNRSTSLAERGVVEGGEGGPQIQPTLAAATHEPVEVQWKGDDGLVHTGKVPWASVAQQGGASVAGATPAVPGNAPAPAAPAPGAAPAVATPPAPSATPAGAIETAAPKLAPLAERSAGLDQKQIEDDHTYVSGLQEAEVASKAQQGQILQTRAIADGLDTGAYAETRARLANIFASFGGDWTQKFLKETTGIDPAKAGAWQELSKLTLQMAGQAENQVAGSHGGFNLVNLFKQSFPGLETQPDAMKEMLNLFLVQHQFNIDHADAAASYYGPAVSNNKANPQAYPYTPVGQAVDKQFLAPGSANAPQVYVAAAAILNNHPLNDAFAALKTPEQKAMALQIAKRADPGMTYTNPAKKGDAPVPPAPGGVPVASQ
jgi:hypothetical protein